MPRATPHTFRRIGDGQRSDQEARTGEMTPLSIGEPLRSALAACVYDARMHAELVALAQRYAEPFAPAPTDALDVVALDQLLDPACDPAQRRALFRRLLSAALAQRQINGVDPRALDDTTALDRLWDATCNWGDAVQRLLDNPEITPITILGTTVIGDGLRGRVRLPNAFASAADPLSRTEFLAHSCGIAWNRETPAVTLTLRRGIRMHLVREPRIIAADEREPGLLIVMRRRRPEPWTLPDLVERGMLDRHAAALLTGLMHAGCAFLIAEPPGAGAATLLESLLNTLDPDRHIVLFDDDTHDVRLRAAALSSWLRGDERQRAVSWQAAVREVLPLPLDVVVGRAVCGDAACALLEQAEAGRATLATIHAGSAEAALQRFARLAAANIPGGHVAGAPLQALRVVSEAFHVVVHVARSQRLQRRFVQRVLLLHGLDAAQQPRTLPLIEAQVAAHAIVWRCHARIEDRALVWETPGVVTPPAIAERLADIPDAVWSAYCRDPLAPLMRAPATEPGAACAEALAKAHTALRDGAWQEAMRHLDAAAQHQHDHQVTRAIDAALAEQPAFARTVDATIAATIQEVRAALQAGDAERAHALISAPPESAVVQRRQVSHAVWQALCAEVAQRTEQVVACQAALTRAKAQQRDGDLRGALQTLRPFDARLVAPALALALLTARQRMLMRLLSQNEGDEAARQQDAADLAQVKRDLAALHGQDNAVAALFAPDAIPTAPGQATMDGAPRQGWLDEALARSRARFRVRQDGQTDGEGAP